MFKRIIFLIVVTVISVSTMSQQTIRQEVYLKDSISTLKFLSTLNLCEKIAYAQTNIQDIIKSKGFSNLILQSISKDSKSKLYITTHNGNMVVKDKNQVIELKEQLNNIKQNQKCH